MAVTHLPNKRPRFRTQLDPILAGESRQAWELTVNRRLQDREKIEGIFERLLPLRQRRG